MARLTLARKIAAIPLTIWKKEVPFLDRSNYPGRGPRLVLTNPVDKTSAHYFLLVGGNDLNVSETNCSTCFSISFMPLCGSRIVFVQRPSRLAASCRPRRHEK